MHKSTPKPLLPTMAPLVATVGTGDLELGRELGYMRESTAAMSDAELRALLVSLMQLRSMRCHLPAPRRHQSRR